MAGEIVSALRTEIISGVVVPGEALAEPVLAARFHVSRAPVREALIELEREGLIMFDPNGRTRVRPLTQKDFQEIMEARSALEVMAARLAGGGAMEGGGHGGFGEKHRRASEGVTHRGTLSAGCRVSCLCDAAQWQ